MEKDLVLIIEDDSTLLRGLRDNFRFKGYDVSEASDGRSGLEATLTLKPALIVLDVMMPEMDGFEVCKRIRNAGLDMPIIMLTAKGREEDIIRGLNAGAHDYMSKPFSIKELLARSGHLLRRNRTQLPDLFKFGHNEVNLVSHKLYHKGEEVTLTPKEFGLLTHFIKNLGRALTREEIMGSVWGSDILVTPRSVDRCINTLRNKVEPEATRPIYIQTIRDIGYRFESSDTQAIPDVEKHSGITAQSPWKVGLAVAGFRLTEKIAPRIWLGEDQKGCAAQLQHLPWLTDTQSHIQLAALARKLEAINHPLPLPVCLALYETQAVWLERGVSPVHLNHQLKGGAMALDQALAIVTTLAQGLGELHKQGILHLNVRTEVVYLGKAMHLGGFGLAEAALSQARAHGRNSLAALARQSPEGWSPQRLRGEKGNERDDIFAIGCLFHELLTANHPFAAPEAVDMVARTLLSDPPDLAERGISKNVCRILSRCLQKDPQDRFASMGDLVFALEGVET